MTGKIMANISAIHTPSVSLLFPNISRRPLVLPVKVKDLRLGSFRLSDLSVPDGRSLARGGRLWRYRPRSGTRASPSEVGRSLTDGPVRWRMSCTSLAYWPHLFRDTTGFSFGARWRSVSRHFSIKVYLPVRPGTKQEVVERS